MKILVGLYSQVAAWNVPESQIERLREAFPQHEFVHVRAEADVAAAIGDVEVAFMSELRPVQFARARRLRWVHSAAAGVGGMLYPELRDSPVVITNSRGMSAATIAEHVLALGLALFRRFPLMLRSQASRQWAQDEITQPPPIRTVAGSRVLIIGLGGIGTACAERFSALGASVTGVRRRTSEPPPRGVSRVVGETELLRALPEADVVVVAAPQTDQTRRLIDRAAFEAMAPGAVLINVSRGKLVDEAALVEALASGRIAGAGLDVFEHEPLDPSSRLWTLPNVIVTPHVAAFREDHWEVATGLFADNLQRFERGEPLVNVVDKAAGY